MRLTTLFAAAAAAYVTSFLGGFADKALAAAGQPTDWAMGFQDSVSPVMDDLVQFDNLLLVLITAISLFVLLLLLIIMVRFNAKANPEPSKTTHNTMIEVVWTIVPILILVMIAIPSFRLLYKQMEIPEADLTIKAIGYQWYWGYEYPDYEGVEFESLMLEDDELAPGQPRLLSTDTDVVVPINATVRMIITAEDVIHSWAIPSFGVKMDAVPGRLNETWFRATELGTYYGQCSELCGIRHAFMPITVKVVTQEEFDEWVKWAAEEYAEAPSTAPASIQVATATR
jgi:cytochrome c oxidase subunit 2